MRSSSCSQRSTGEEGKARKARQSARTTAAHAAGGNTREARILQQYLCVLCSPFLSGRPSPPGAPTALSSTNNKQALARGGSQQQEKSRS